jgi:O-acetylserine/cysteine efflux transporter
MKYQLFSIFVVLSWGLNFAISKIGLAEVPPFFLLSVRFGIAGLIFLPFATFDRKKLFPLLKIGLTFNVGHYGFIFVALSILPGSAVAIIMQSQVPIAILLSYIFFQEKISTKQSFGVIIAIVGVLLIYGIPKLNYAGLLLGLLGSFCWGITQVLMKKNPMINKATYITVTHLFSAPFLLILSFIFEQRVDWEVVNISLFGGVLFYQIVILSLSMAFWQDLIAHHGVNKVSPFSLLQVVFALAGTFFILHEPLTPLILLGAGLTICGVYFTTIAKGGTAGQIPPQR